MTHPASRLEKLKEAIAHYEHADYESSMTEPTYMKVMLEAARSYAALMPLLRDLVEARGKAQKPCRVYNNYDYAIMEDDDAIFYNTAYKSVIQIGNILDGEE